MKIFVRLFISLKLCMLVPVLGMKNIKLPNIKKNILKKNYFKPSFGTAALKYKAFFPKNYSSFANLKFNKATKPNSNTLLLNKNVALPKKSLNRAYNQDVNSGQTEKKVEKSQKEKIIDEKNNPKEAGKIVSDVVEEWVKEKPYLERDPKTGFFTSNDPKKRNNERNQETSRTRQFLNKYWLIAAAWAYPIKNLLWPEDELVSKKPLAPTQTPSKYPEELYIYALDGEMAKTMTADDFANALHAAGLTVKDSVKIACQIQEERAYEELTIAAELSDHDWNLLHNILKLKHDFLKGDYNENNVTFEGSFDNDVIDMVKTALKRSNIPFQVKVHANPEGEEESTLGSAVVREQTKFFAIGDKVKITWVPEEALTFKYHLSTGTAGTVGKNIVAEIYLSPWLLSQSKQKIKATIAHEVTHTANLHHLESIFFRKYATRVKKLNNDQYNTSMKILDTIHEYQADVLPLADVEYAKAEREKFDLYRKNFTTGRPDIYVPTKKMYELASRAVELHYAEKRIKSNAVTLQLPTIKTEKKQEPIIEPELKKQTYWNMLFGRKYDKK